MTQEYIYVQSNQVKISKLGSDFYVFCGSLLLMFILLGWFGMVYKTLPLQLPWLYSNPWGETQLVARQALGIFWAIHAIAVIIFFVWSIKLGKTEKSLSFVVNGAVLLATVFIFLSGIKVLFLFS